MATNRNLLAYCPALDELPTRSGQVLLVWPGCLHCPHVRPVVFCCLSPLLSSEWARTRFVPLGLPTFGGGRGGYRTKRSTWPLCRTDSISMEGLPSLRPPSLTPCPLVPLTEVHPPHPNLPFESGSGALQPSTAGNPTNTKRVSFVTSPVMHLSLVTL